jgi:antitoxin (DNA-binding transcriptional repressor) of toxin-antitoxin stability system
MQLVGSRELRAKLPAYLRWAERGEQFVILVNRRPAAILRAFRIDDDGAIVSSDLLRTELHRAIARLSTGSLIVIRYSRVVAVLEAPPASLQFQLSEEAS